MSVKEGEILLLMSASLKLAAVKRELNKLEVKETYKKIAQLVIQENQAASGHKPPDRPDRFVAPGAALPCPIARPIPGAYPVNPYPKGRQ